MTEPDVRQSDNQPEQQTESQSEKQSPKQEPAGDMAKCEQELLKTLTHELFQTERSADVHPQREADRLGDVPPAEALRTVSAHAREVLQELPALAKKHGLPDSFAGQAIGEFFSDMRQLVADRLIDPERSYRGTLLGLRHGLDLVELIRQVARVRGNGELADWCAGWLAKRQPLVDAVAAQLAWFAQFPDQATGKHGGGLLKRVVEQCSDALKQRNSQTTT